MTRLEFDPEPDGVFVLNDPFVGGTHLPDVTVVSLISPCSEIVGDAVSRGHHADVGGLEQQLSAGETCAQLDSLRNCVLAATPISKLVRTIRAGSRAVEAVPRGSRRRGS